MLLSLNKSNTKHEGIEMTYGSTLEDMIQLNKGDKIALKRFHFKLSNTNRDMFLGGFGLKRFKLFIKCLDNLRVSYKEDLFHTFTLTFEDDSYTFEAGKDDLIFQECGFEESLVFSFKIYGVLGEPIKYVPIMIDDDSTFELDWVIQKAAAT